MCESLLWTGEAETYKFLSFFLKKLLTFYHQLIDYSCNHYSSELINLYWIKYMCLFTAELIMCVFSRGLCSPALLERGNSTALDRNFKYDSNLIEIEPPQWGTVNFLKSSFTISRPRHERTDQVKDRRKADGKTEQGSERKGRREGGREDGSGRVKRGKKKTAWGEKIPPERESVTGRTRWHTVRESHRSELKEIWSWKEWMRKKGWKIAWVIKHTCVERGLVGLWVA